LKTFFRIIGLLIISQVLVFGFVFIVADTSIGGLSDVDTKGLIDKLGLKAYLFYTQIMSVLLPAVLFLLIVHYKNLAGWVKLKLPANRHFFMYSIMLLILSYPLIQLSAQLNEYMPFADFLSEESDYIEELMKQILVMNSPVDFVVNLVIIALLPAIGEELFFRAIIQNELLASINKKDIAIILTAVIFSAFHLQFDGFLPRFFLGLILGYVYYWSGSIWVSISLHFINNGLLVISAYMLQDKIDEVSAETSHAIPMYIIVMSVVAVFVLRNKLIELSEEDKHSEFVINE